MRIGILELLSDSADQKWGARLFDRWFARQYASITPQAVAVWCRQLGHEVHYATYYGQQDPKSLLPDSLDVVFLATYTHAAPLAYALAKLHRAEGALTVVGGPHARSYPADCLRFFDHAVHDCDKALIDDIVRGRFERGTLVTSGRPLTDLPSVEERMPEIEIANFSGGRPTMFSNIGLLTSIGCPYNCGFCVDWNNPFVLLAPEKLEADLRYISRRFPGMLVSYHDPNFGVKFDRVIEVMNRIPEGSRNPYVMESSLSLLRGDRVGRLAETNCVYIAPGVEGWADYSNKAGVGSSTGRDKLDEVAAHFEDLHTRVPGLQANFIFGTDLDAGDEPFELTKEFIHRVPYVWAALNIPVPIGGTPLFDAHLAEGRILKRMPFGLYYNPYMVTRLQNYDPLEYYEKMIEVHATVSSTAMLTRRLASSAPRGLKAMFVLRTLAMKRRLSELRVIRDQLKSNSRFAAFHEGEPVALPEFYRRRSRERLGRYSELITDAEMQPELCASVVPVGLPSSARKPARELEVALNA